MKYFNKKLLSAALLVTISCSVSAQSNRASAQANLPSNRPLPDKRMIERKFENMRIAARKQEVLLKKADQERSQLLRVQPSDNPKTKPSTTGF
jgi:hypothetical protein